MQDKSLSKEKQAILIEELSILGIPAGALVAGVRSLMHEDLKSLKLITIIEAARAHVTYENYESVSCDDCEGRGIIILKDQFHYEKAFRCHCDNSLRQQWSKLAIWNRESTQDHNGYSFRLKFAA